MGVTKVYKITKLDYVEPELAIYEDHEDNDFLFVRKGEILLTLDKNQLQQFAYGLYRYVNKMNAFTE